MGDRFRDYDVSTSQPEGDDASERLDEIIKPEEDDKQDMSEEGADEVS